MSVSERHSPSSCLVAAAAGLALLLAACGSGEPVAGTDATASVTAAAPDENEGADDATDEVPAAPADAIELPGEGRHDGGRAAAVGGILVGDPATGCLTFDSDSAHGDHTPSTILWPAGWTITRDGTIHDHHGAARFAIGDRIEAGGGVATDVVPEACRTGPGDVGVQIHSIRKVD